MVVRRPGKFIVLGLFVVVVISLLHDSASSKPISPATLSADGEVASRLTSPCPLLVEGEGEGEGEPAYTVVHPAVRALRHVLQLLAAALVIASAAPGIKKHIGHRWITAALAFCALGAVGSFAFSDRTAEGRFVNGWEFFHYYLGSKYAPELGYTGLYDAALVADVETGRHFSHERDAIRDLRTGGCIPVEEVLSERQAIKSRFSAARWTEFSSDIQYFKERLPIERWNGLFRDKGYNPSPVWTMVAAPLANLVSTSNPRGMVALALLDPILLFIAFLAVWRTFGIRAALLMVILMGTHMTASHSHMKGAFLRTDWLSALILAVCAVKAKHPAVGGALVAYAAAVRVFPAFFAGGLVIAAAYRGPAQRDRLRFGVGLAVTFVLLLALSALAVAPGTWQGFVEKIWQHHDSFSPWRVGFKNIFLGTYEYLPNGNTHQEVYRQRWLPWWVLQGLMLAGLALIVRRLENWETLAVGFVPVFFLVAPTYYYYIMLVIPLLFFCGRLPRPECVWGIAWLLGSSSIAYLVEDAVGRELLLFYALSLIVFSLCVQMVFSASRVIQGPSGLP